MVVRREVMTWTDVDKLIDHLMPQFEVEFDAMVMITRGGVVPGGMLAEALNLQTILTASVDFPSQMEELKKEETQSAKLVYWPKFLQFPVDNLLRDQRVLVVDDVWGSGRTITAVKNRVSGLGGNPYTCVLHFNPNRNLFGKFRPDYFAATTDAYIVYPWETPRSRENTVVGGYDQ